MAGRGPVVAALTASMVYRRMAALPQVGQEVAAHMRSVLLFCIVLCACYAMSGTGVPCPVLECLTCGQYCAAGMYRDAVSTALLVYRALCDVRYWRGAVCCSRTCPALAYWYRAERVVHAVLGTDVGARACQRERKRVRAHRNPSAPASHGRRHEPGQLRICVLNMLNVDTDAFIEYIDAFTEYIECMYMDIYGYVCGHMPRFAPRAL